MRAARGQHDDTRSVSVSVSISVSVTNSVSVNTLALPKAPSLAGKYVRGRSVKGKRPAVSQGCQIDRFTLKPSSLASVKVKHWTIAVGQGVKVRSHLDQGYGRGRPRIAFPKAL